MQTDGDIARKRPRRRRPDKEIGLLPVREDHPLIALDGELDIERIASLVPILDLRLGQRRTVFGTPVDGLQPFVYQPFLIHFAEDAHLPRLKSRVHGQIGVFPVGQHAETGKLLPLNINIVRGKLRAGVAEGGDAHLVAVELLFLDDGALDRHTVIVPARYHRGIAPVHVFIADDEILEDLVQRRSRVDAVVGERRAVVENKRRLVFVALHQPGVGFLQMRQPARLTRGERSPHRKVGLGQVEGLVVVHNTASSRCNGKCIISLTDKDCKVYNDSSPCERNKKTAARSPSNAPPLECR
jgi:hypothetical protein